MGVHLDRDVEIVLEFMERNIEMSKLGRVAAKVATLAPVLWDAQDCLYQQSLITFTPEARRGQLATATQLLPAQECADDGSVAAEGSPLQM
jgi:hypothetical protein